MDFEIDLCLFVCACIVSHSFIRHSFFFFSLSMYRHFATYASLSPYPTNRFTSFSEVVASTRTIRQDSASNHLAQNSLAAPTTEGLRTRAASPRPRHNLAEISVSDFLPPHPLYEYKHIVTRVRYCHMLI